MPNVLKAGAQWLHQTLAESAGESIVYTPLNRSPIDMTATIGQTDFPLEIDDNGLAHTWQSRDFIILRELFVVNGAAFEPCVGDEIEWESGGRLLTFEVRAPGDEPPFRWSDKFHTALRVAAATALVFIPKSKIRSAACSHPKTRVSILAAAAIPSLPRLPSPPNSRETRTEALFAGVAALPTSTT